MKKLLIISGWAHGLDSIRPLGDALSGRFDVQLLTGAQLLRERKIPDTEIMIAPSMGGLLAMELLPHCCEKLVLISSTAKFCADETYPCGTSEKILSKMILQLKRHPDAVMEAFYQNVHYPNPSQKTQSGCSQEELVAGLEYLLTSDVREKIADIKIPVLLLHGTEDRIIPSSASEWLHAHLPASRLHLFKKSGHALPSYQLNEIMDICTSFL